MVPHPDRGTPFLVATANPDASNAVWASDDGGYTWIELAQTKTRAAYRSLVWLPTAERFAALAVSEDDALPPRLLLAEVDTGAWSEVAHSLPAGSNPRLLANLERPPEVLVAIQEGDDNVLAVLDLDNGAAQTLAQAAFATRFVQAASHGSGLWVLDTADSLWRWNGDALVPAGQGSISCVYVEPRDGRLWTCAELEPGGPARLRVE